MSVAVSIAPKGRKTIAQGEALGLRPTNFLSPERAAQRTHEKWFALSGLGIFRTFNPGLRPGLSNDGLSGLDRAEHGGVESGVIQPM